MILEFKTWINETVAQQLKKHRSNPALDSHVKGIRAYFEGTPIKPLMNSDIYKRFEKWLTLQIFKLLPNPAHDVGDIRQFCHAILDRNMDYVVRMLSTDNQQFKSKMNDENYIPDTLTRDSTAWHESLKKKGKSWNTDPGTVIVVCRQPGFYWVDLNKQYSEKEAKAMGHCGNEAGYPGETIFSLREIPGQYKVGDSVSGTARLTFIVSRGGEIRSLGESKGFGNEKPDKMYHPQILDLLTAKDKDGRPYIEHNRGGGYLPHNNFHIDDLSPEDRKHLAKGNLGIIVGKIIHQFGDGWLWCIAPIQNTHERSTYERWILRDNNYDPVLNVNVGIVDAGNKRNIRFLSSEHSELANMRTLINKRNHGEDINELMARVKKYFENPLAEFKKIQKYLIWLFKNKIDVLERPKSMNDYAFQVLPKELKTELSDKKSFLVSGMHKSNFTNAGGYRWLDAKDLMEKDKNVYYLLNDENQYIFSTSVSKFDKSNLLYAYDASWAFTPEEMKKVHGDPNDWSRLIADFLIKKVEFLREPFSKQRSNFELSQLNESDQNRVLARKPDINNAPKFAVKAGGKNLESVRSILKSISPGLFGHQVQVKEDKDGLYIDFYSVTDMVNRGQGTNLPLSKGTNEIRNSVNTVLYEPQRKAIHPFSAALKRVFSKTVRGVNNKTFELMDLDRMQYISNDIFFETVTTSTMNKFFKLFFDQYLRGKVGSGGLFYKLQQPADIRLCGKFYDIDLSEGITNTMELEFIDELRIPKDAGKELAKRVPVQIDNKILRKIIKDKIYRW